MATPSGKEFGTETTKSQINGKNERARVLAGRVPKAEELGTVYELPNEVSHVERETLNVVCAVK